MNGKTMALTQINEKLDELEQVKELLAKADAEELVHLYATCHERGINLFHYFTDNRELLRDIKEYLNEVLQESGFSFSMQEMHLNSDKLTVTHHQLGTVGELYLGKKRLWVWKNPFRFVIQNEKELARLAVEIPKSEERIRRYEKELADYQKLPAPIKKLRGFTPSKLEQMARVIENEKGDLKTAQQNRDRLHAAKAEDWGRFVERSFEFKRFLLKMDAFGFKNDFHAFDAKKTYVMRYRENTQAHLSGVLTYEEGHLSLLHKGEWNTDELKDPQYQLFRFTEEEFHYLFEQIKSHFAQAKREWIGNSDILSIETENGDFFISKEGFIIIDGEDINLYHLLRFSAIRKALCLLYKERTREDARNAIKRL